MIRRSRRGRLKIYLGYGAGVGKTYQMLQEGHRLKGEGIDVVVGLVETHGRIETANLVQGLEVIPRKRYEYRGHILEEMDVGAILARKPEVVLIDELAHTNVPGTENPKRYQDVQDILAAGIHVITTLNVQHLESLYDTVEKTVHVKVRERLPDTVVADADEIVNVDLTTEDLQQRLKEGKIYPSERVEAALANFFQTQNLEKLRELTLRELASQLDLRMRQSTDEASDATPDQVMVCLSSRGPNSEMLLRYGSRLAGRLNRNWYAVYVQTPSEDPTVIASHTQRILSTTMTLAKQLGATVFTYKGEDITDTILRFAHEYRVGHIVLGYPGELPLWKRLLGKKSTVEQLIRKSRGITVVVLDTRVDEPPQEKSQPETLRDVREARRKASKLCMSNLLSSRRIIIWDHPVSKDLVLRTLVEISVRDVEAGSYGDILEAVKKREDECSTFSNEAVAFPHVRIDSISVPIMGLAVARQGVTDVDVDKPINLVFLVLSPVQGPAMQVEALALISRVASDRQLVHELLAATNPDGALRIIQNWESVGTSGFRKSPQACAE